MTFPMDKAPYDEIVQLRASNEELKASLSKLQAQLNDHQIAFQKIQASNGNLLSGLQAQLKSPGIAHTHSVSPPPQEKMVNLSFFKLFSNEVDQKILEAMNFARVIKGQADEDSKKLRGLLDKVEGMHPKLESMVNQVRAAKDKVAEHDLSLLGVSSQQASHQNVMSAFHASIQEHKAKMEEGIAHLKASVLMHADNLRSEFNAKFQSLKIPDLSDCAKKGDLHAMQHQISLSTLDAKNAFVKSNINEMQHQILLKKLDNISIQLKAREISNP